MTDLGELICVEFRDLFSILSGPLAVLTVGALLVGCMQCAHGTLHIRLPGGDNNNNSYSLYSLYILFYRDLFPLFFKSVLSLDRYFQSSLYCSLRLKTLTVFGAVLENKTGFVFSVDSFFPITAVFVSSKF